MTPEDIARLSVTELRVRLVEKGQPLSESCEEALSCDPRAGAREVLRLVLRRRHENRCEGQRLRNLLRYEVELWEKGLFLRLGAYQHHAFLDWRFVEGAEWQAVNEALNGAGVESVHAQWQQMFGPAELEPAAPVSLPPALQPAPRKRAARKSTKATGGKPAAKRASAKAKTAATKSVTKSSTKTPSGKASSKVTSTGNQKTTGAAKKSGRRSTRTPKKGEADAE